MSEITLNIEESIAAAAAKDSNTKSAAETSTVPGPTVTQPLLVDEDDALSTNTISDLGAAPSSSDAIGATEENPLKPPDPNEDRQGTGGGGAGSASNTIIHHQNPNPYASYCLPCCPQSIIPSTKPKFLLFSLCCALSFISAILLSVCFFYPETFFDVQADVIHKLATQQQGGLSNSGHGKMIHHPHQNRKIVQSGSARRILSTGQASFVDGMDDDDESDSNNDDIYDGTNGNINNNNAAGGGRLLNNNNYGDLEEDDEGLGLQISDTHKPIVTFDSLIEASNFTNVVQGRFLHFDLKGAPPTVTYMKEVMKLAKDTGITGVLIEWEDTFPWKGRLINTTLANNAGYSESDVIDILKYAEDELNLDVIPLIQTFGHVEYILKLKDFFHLREDPNDPQAFCPLLKETLEIIEEMMRQIVALHKNSKFIHIGCDEVFNIGSCPLCTHFHSGKVVSYDSNEHLFLKHVKNVAEIAIKYGKIPIIWDDMLRTISYDNLNQYNLGSLVEIMVWCYAEDIEKFISTDQWNKYSKLFPTIWVAGSFKGAFGETLQIPPITRHAENTQNWLQLILRESFNWEIGLGGIVLTGWSRYDHFSVLCELFPTSIPSFVYTSLILSVPSLNTENIIFKNRVFLSSDFIQDDNQINNNQLKKNRTEITAIEGPIQLPLKNKAARTPGGLIRKRRGTKWIPHPQSLKINSAPISTFSRSTNSYSAWKSNNKAAAGHDNSALIIRCNLAHITTEFSRILNCAFDSSSIQYQILPQLIQDSEDLISSASFSSVTSSSSSSSSASSLISQCNFHGINFYRSLLKLQSLQSEIYTLDSSLKRDRGWLTAYNQRHNYSIPFRLNELLFKDSLILRLKRNLVQISKSLGIGLKNLYKPNTILEWLELNVWNLWEILDNWEKIGEQLKSIKIWERRPLKTPEKLIYDLGLLPLGLEQRKKRNEL